MPPLLVLGLELLHLLALLVPALLKGELHLPLLRPLLLDLLQLLLFFPNAGVELLRPLELGLLGAPLALGGDLLRQQLLLSEGVLLGLLFQFAKLGAKLGQQFLLLLHLQGEAGQLVVIGAGHLGLLGAGELLALGGGRTVGCLRCGQGRLPLLTSLLLGGDAAVEVAQVLHQLLLLLLVLEAGGEADLLAHPLLAGRLVHQCHIAEPLADGGQLLQLLPRPFMGLNGNGGVELGAGHPFEQGRTLVGARFEQGGKLPLGQDDGAAKLLPGEPHQLVDTLLQLPLAATEYLARRHVGQAALLGLKAPLGAVAGTAYRPAGQPDAAVAAAKLHLGKTAGVAAAEDAAHVVGLELLLVIHAAHFGHVLAIGDKARHLVVERQADGIEQGTLAGPRVAGDGKQAGGPQGTTGKIDGELTGQAGQILP